MFLEQKLSSQKKKKGKLKNIKKMDKENSHENKNLENLYIDLDSLIVKLSSEKGKIFYLKNYDIQNLMKKVDNFIKILNNIKMI